MTKRTNVEIGNTITHIIGALIAIPASWIIIYNGFLQDFTTGFAMVIFSVGMFIMYLASSLYHWATDEKIKRLFRHFDHANIYILIAASYTPIWLCTVGGTLGNVMCFVLWIVALCGIIYKIIALGKYPKLSLAIYLIMGWSIVFAFRPVIENLSTQQIIFIVTEGLCYTIGTYFYSHKEKPWYHVIWHLFVLGGTAFHYAAILPIALGKR
ncbi:MAG: hemolysin III family protein [Bacteroidales bacterium]|nr:hemolysin III family protein [Bacteroidales bacterium]